MTSRERWTVYPLLLLAIGLAVRAVGLARERPDTLVVEAIDTGRVRCRELVITGGDEGVVVHLGRVKGGGGRIELKTAAGTDAIAIGVRPDEPLAGIEFHDAEGRPAGRLTAAAASHAGTGPASGAEAAHEDAPPAAD